MPIDKCIRNAEQSNHRNPVEKSDTKKTKRNAQNEKSVSDNKNKEKTFLPSFPVRNSNINKITYNAVFVKSEK